MGAGDSPLLAGTLGAATADRPEGVRELADGC